jgi:cysteinyl-tRNA synthetase
MHNNMITINGQKMGKSLGNFITLQQLFHGDHEKLEQAYSPMTIRYFILTAHYRSTLDFSNQALQAAQKGYKKLINGYRIAKRLQYTEDPETAVQSDQVDQVNKSIEAALGSMDDDFNTAQAIGHLFNLLKKINSLYTGQLNPAVFGKETFDKMIQTYVRFLDGILGLTEEKTSNQDQLLEIILNIYSKAKTARDYKKVDEIRAALKAMGIIVKDMKHQIDWAYEE